MKTQNTEEFWNGWTEALDSLDTRIKSLRLISHRSDFHDALSDVCHEIKELRQIYGGDLQV